MLCRCAHVSEAEGDHMSATGRHLLPAAISAAHPLIPPLHSLPPASLDDITHSPSILVCSPTLLCQVIQRWLVIFARQHLYNICIKLMDAAKAADAAAEAAAAEKPVRRRKQLLPSLSKADDDDDIESAASAPSDAEHIDSESYFVLDCLRRVLSAAADVTGSRGDGLGGYTILDDENLVGARGGLGKLGTQGGAAALAPGPGSVATGDALAPLRGAPDGLLAFCYSRVHVSRPSPIRTVASECVGILSLVALKPLVTMLIEGMNKVASDRDEREWVAYQRAARLIHLSTHSAEQAGASLRYLKAVASAMSRTNRGVLRLEICRSLTSSLERLMVRPAHSPRRSRTLPLACALDPCTLILTPANQLAHHLWTHRLPLTNHPRPSGANIALAPRRASGGLPTLRPMATPHAGRRGSLPMRTSALSL